MVIYHRRLSAGSVVAERILLILFVSSEVAGRPRESSLVLVNYYLVLLRCILHLTAAKIQKNMTQKTYHSIQFRMLHCCFL